MILCCTFFPWKSMAEILEKSIHTMPGVGMSTYILFHSHLNLQFSGLWPSEVIERFNTRSGSPKKRCQNFPFIIYWVLSSSSSLHLIHFAMKFLRYDTCSQSHHLPCTALSHLAAQWLLLAYPDIYSHRKTFNYDMQNNYWQKNWREENNPIFSLLCLMNMLIEMHHN